MPKARTLSILGKVATSSSVVTEGGGNSSPSLAVISHRSATPCMERNPTPPLDDGLVIASQASQGEANLANAAAAAAVEGIQSPPDAQADAAAGGEKLLQPQGGSLTQGTAKANKTTDALLPPGDDSVKTLENEISWHEIVAQRVPHPNGKG